ncbi:MAG: glycoside hydrolase family 99-like domain-containing protein, partial [Nanoarchaeota archaeon]|nr:glycoside hydrolase family 99-like domain-containing protein [Nanoarchaeota archaeon]
TNVTKAKPIFEGHHQPNLPADLGFYDLRVPEVREEQARLAKEHNIEGFCYWHYWFGNGKRILERPFNEVLKSGKPYFPFCLGWANQSWTGIWHGLDDEILIKQEYGGLEDYQMHFNSVLGAFKDKRYITIDDKKLFLIFNPSNIPKLNLFIDTWRRMAKKEGFDIFFMSCESRKSLLGCGFDGMMDISLLNTVINVPSISTISRCFRVVDYSDVIGKNFNNPLQKYEYPVVIPNWDNTPRSGNKGVVMHNSNPGLFKKMLKKAIKLIKSRDSELRLIFIKSWNEWAEGNYLEPDQRWGRAYLEVLKEELIGTEK